MIDENSYYLVLPDIQYKSQFNKAINEYLTNCEVAKYEYYKTALLDFNKYVNDFKDHSEGINLPNECIPRFTYWLSDNENNIYGIVRIRKKLNEYFCKFGGNIGYDIIPSFRKKGFGSLILKLALVKIKELNMNKVLITCDSDNIGSKKIIERNGGIFESEIFEDNSKIGKLRYWIYIK